MRALLAGLAVAVATAVPAVAKDNPGARTWLLTFTPTAKHVVGEPLPRGSDTCEGSCHSAYRYTDANDRSPQTLVLHADDPSCTSPPCDMRVAPNVAGTGFTGTIHWDGTTYAGTGSGVMSAGSESCDALLPKDPDRMTFTVDGDTLTGTATFLMGWYAQTESGTQRCLKLLGYESFDGTITGRPTGVTRPGTTAGGVGSRPLTAEAARKAALDAALRAHERAPVSLTVPAADRVGWAPSRVAVSALLALLLVALMPFPAALFNATLESNYDEVRGWFRWVPRRASGAARQWRSFAIVVLAAAVLNAFLDPRLRLDAASLEMVAGLALSIAAVSLLAVLPARLAHGQRPEIRVYPIGLVVAALCVLVSRLTSFEPGYLYGVIAGFAFTREVAKDEKGRIAFATSSFLLLAAVAAFLVRVPVHDAAGDGSVPLVLLDTVLAAVFAAGVEANVLGLLPLRFLPGEAVMAWRRWAWAAAFGVSLFAFLHALAAKAGEDSTAASVTVAAVLFGTFATVSVAFWAWFRFRPKDPTPVSV